MVEVVAALIRDGERFLICQRPVHKARPLLWEFPGGKVQDGETGAEALTRECQEELDVLLEVGEPVAQVEYEYPDVTIHLSLLEARIAHGELRLLEHADARWITVDELGEYELCPADAMLVQRMVEG